MNKAKREATRKAKKSSPSGEATAEVLGQNEEESLSSEVESGSSATENMPFESILRALELQRQTDGDVSSSKPDKNEMNPGATEADQKDDSQASAATHVEDDRESSPPQNIQSSESGDGGEESLNGSTPADGSAASNKLVAGLRKELEMEKAKSSMLVRLLEETLHPQAPLPFLRQQYLALMGASTSREQLK